MVLENNSTISNLHNCKLDIELLGEHTSSLVHYIITNAIHSTIVEKEEDHAWKHSSSKDWATALTWRHKNGSLED